MKNKYTFPHKSRKDIRDYFESLGSYYSYDYRTTFPFSFNVRINGGIPEYPTVENTIQEYYGETNELFKFMYDVVVNDEQCVFNLYNWTLQNMVESLHSDDMFKSNGKEYVDVEYGLVGRSGGNMIITRFEYVDFTKINDDEFLDSVYMDKPDDYTLAEHKEECDDVYLPFDFVLKLYRLLRILDYDFNTNNVHEKEYEYELSFNMMEEIIQRLEDVGNTTRNHIKTLTMLCK